MTTVQLPLGETTLLLAGPRAGKTSLLLQWREACAQPAQYVAVTPEDAESAFFLRRLFAGWPALRTRFEELRAEMPGVSWGGLAGMAIAEACPDFCLLLDDFHHVEGMPGREDWLALVRHFPLGGTLAIASRHAFPAFNRPAVRLLGPDEALWSESPLLADLEALAPETFAAAIALHVVGELRSPQRGEELARLAIAQVDPAGAYRPRPLWNPPLAAALHGLGAASEVWDVVEAELMAFHHHHLRRPDETLAAEALGRIPSAIRQVRPTLLLLEGDLHFTEARFVDARACYARAAALVTMPDEAVPYRVRRFAAAVVLREAEEIAELSPLLEADRAGFTPQLEAIWRFWFGLQRWYEGDVPAAKMELQRVLSIPAAGDRRVLHYQARTLRSLSAICADMGQLSEGSAFAERAVSQGLTHALSRDLLMAFARRFHCLLYNEAAPPGLQLLLEVPDDALRVAPPAGLLHFLIGSAWRAVVLGAYGVALRQYRIAMAHALAFGLVEAGLTAKYGVMYALAMTDDYARARQCYEELREVSANRQLASHLALNWAQALLLMGRLDEAEVALDEAPAQPWSRNDMRERMYRFWLRHMRGDEAAVQEARALIDTREASFLWDCEFDATTRLGLRAERSSFHVRAFGETSFIRIGKEPPRWSRRKALGLLAHLALEPDGVPSEELIERLYPDSDSADPGAALHTLAYTLRQGLGTIGAAELLESSRGSFRFRWDQVAFCDLHDFDAFYAKAQTLEAGGMLPLAATMYRLALTVVKGGLFEDLGDAAFEAPRLAYAAKIAHARSFSKTHAAHLWSSGED